MMAKSGEDDEGLWYKDAVIYELHVKSFYDSNDDGIGDIRGIIEKLDYLETLGITVVWLLPFYPSPLRDDGYDISDYTGINPDYGTLDDFRELLGAAHARGLKIITELVINHTSDQHAWFGRARRAKSGSVERDYYVWSGTPDKYHDARVIFTDFESSNWTFDPVAGAYYWHRFYSHQPDLNFGNAAVQKEIIQVLDFWFEMGVDGMRLDAVPYLYEREGTNCENLPETYAFLRKLRAHIDSKYKNKMLLAEANQWPEDAVAYFGKGDICEMAFHFPLMPRLFMALQMEDRFPIVDILEETPPIPPNCQWGLFLRNHDELTLEMVTDEERDYMYRIYALDPRAKINLGIRRRLAPLLDNNRRKIELMCALLLSLPGTPIIYYGDEIGMGDNFYLGDRNGVRTPMQWSPDRNAGFSKVNPQRLHLPVVIDPEYHYEVVNVETQNRNISSLLWWTRRALAMRKRYKAMGRGSFDVINADNPKILAFTRILDDERILVVVNLSRFPQIVGLDLSEHIDYQPRELYGQNKFPVIKAGSYTLTMGPHSILAFELQKKRATVDVETIRDHITPLHVSMNWQSCLRGKYADILEDRILPAYLQRCRWFGAKARTIIRTRITETLPFFVGERLESYILILDVNLSEGMPERYQIPLSYGSRKVLEKFIEANPRALISPLFVDDEEGVLYDSTFNESFRDAILAAISHDKRVKGQAGQLQATSQGQMRSMVYEAAPLELSASLVKSEQSNSSFVYGSRFMLKFYRRLDDGINPDLELLKALNDRAFKYVPPLYGHIEYSVPGHDQVLTALLQGYVANEGDGWDFSKNSLTQFFEAVLTTHSDISDFGLPVPLLIDDTAIIPKPLEDMVGHLYLQLISTLGVRTAQMHKVLGSVEDDTAIRPEPFTLFYQNSVYQSARGQARRSLRLLRSMLESLGSEAHLQASRVLDLEGAILASLNNVRQEKITALKSRIHGDYHLGQVLYTGKDFIIIDFEGEPARPLSERRLKRSCLRDVAGMIRSFHYVVNSELTRHGIIRPEDVARLEPWTDLWYHCVSATFTHAYLSELADSALIPVSKEHRGILLQTFLLQKSLYELQYELNNRPDWVIIPLKGIIHTVEGHGNAKEHNANT